MRWTDILSGAVIAAIINILFNWLKSSQDNKRNFLNDQLLKLYAPLYFLTLQCKKSFELNNKLYEISSKRYENRQVSNLPLAQQRETEDINNIITTRNNYVAPVSEANQKIKELLDSNFAYIDPDDVKLFMDFFYEHYLRGNAETTENRIPIDVHKEMGEISFLRPEFIERVELKFLKKQRKLGNKFKLFG